MSTKRPLSHRVWFWKPQLHWFGWRTLVPFYRGGDEWDWHTIVLGWTITGRVIFATRRCSGDGRCGDIEVLAPDWPADPYAELEQTRIADGDDEPPALEAS